MEKLVVLLVVAPEEGRAISGDIPSMETMTAVFEGDRERFFDWIWFFGETHNGKSADRALCMMNALYRSIPQRRERIRILRKIRRFVNRAEGHCKRNAYPSENVEELRERLFQKLFRAGG